MNHEIASAEKHRLAMTELKQNILTAAEDVGRRIEKSLRWY